MAAAPRGPRPLPPTTQNCHNSTAVDKRPLPGGWNVTFNPIVLTTVAARGVVMKSVGAAGLTDIPTRFGHALSEFGGSNELFAGLFYSARGPVSFSKQLHFRSCLALKME